MPLIYQNKLPNRLVLTVEDHSNRYYGDYHRVKLLVRCLVPVNAESFADSTDPVAEAAEALRILGPEIVFEKSLERMGVPGDEVEQTRQFLLEQFLQTNRSYLASKAFVPKFIALKLRDKRSSGLPADRY